jgi:hypothetical protein
MFALEQGHGFRTGGRGEELVVLLAEDPAHGVEDVGFIVHKDDLIHLGLPGRRVGVRGCALPTIIIEKKGSQSSHFLFL